MALLLAVVSLELRGNPPVPSLLVGMLPKGPAQWTFPSMEIHLLTHFNPYLHFIFEWILDWSWQSFPTGLSRRALLQLGTARALSRSAQALVQAHSNTAWRGTWHILHSRNKTQMAKLSWGVCQALHKTAKVPSPCWLGHMESGPPLTQRVPLSWC